MSTILKTLKKLEEEKSVLEKKLDLKEVVLQDEERRYVSSPLSTTGKSLWKGALLLTAIVLALIWVSKDNPTKNQVARISPPNTIFQPSPIQVKKQANSSVPGIPLSNIPEQKRRQVYDDSVLEREISIIEKAISNKKEEIIEPVKQPSRPVRGNAYQENEFNEIQSLIASAKSLADEPAEVLISRINSNRTIPGLKVKGIIFFSDGSSSNHIFVSTQKSNNQKVRVGDSIGSATLMKIESNGGVFSYQGENIFMGIGQAGG